MKNAILSALGIVGGFVSYLVGGFDASIVTLLMFMLVDYITGFIVAGVFHKSNKSETGNLESRAGWKGLCKKFATLLFIVIANRLDMQMGTVFIRDAVAITFITNELLSIVENAGLMGIPIPKAISQAISILQNKDEEKKEEQKDDVSNAG